MHWVKPGLSVTGKMQGQPDSFHAHCTCAHSSPHWPTSASTKGEGRAGCLCDRPEGQNDELPASRELHGSLAKALNSCSHTTFRVYIRIVSGPIGNYKPAEAPVPHRTGSRDSFYKVLSVCNGTTLDVTKLCHCWSPRLLMSTSFKCRLKNPTWLNSTKACTGLALGLSFLKGHPFDENLNGIS